MTAPPAGLCSDAQSLAARLLGHKGELSHCTATETIKCGCHSKGHHSDLSNKEEEEREGERMEMHAGNDGQTYKKVDYSGVYIHCSSLSDLPGFKTVQSHIFFVFLIL